ncbi:acyl-CoA N-acyltransferase [Patellaria atrata CBS 101060]|uniref:Acyl-CoA N-acyltransferase n=1 Tax=Patellaria atrata CBS 101060 TaxID=1346257 RepID=A0A9P4S422_9PEZI|nr:acyl-CoA N-acyltransferase [Patellaria atrata CBS 101060]
MTAPFSNLTLRPATRRDLADIIDICEASFTGSEFYGPAVHPNRKEFHAQHVKFETHKYRLRFVAENSRFLLACDAAGKLVGVSFWQFRGGNPPTGWDTNQSIGSKIENALLKAEGVYNEHVALPAVDFARIRRFKGMKPKEIDAVRRIHLSILAIPPRYQGKGVGTALLQWGFDEATGLGLPVSLISSKAGRGFYPKFGFKKFAVVSLDGDKEYGINSAVFLWEPPALSGQWLVEDRTGAWRVKGGGRDEKAKDGGEHSS